MKRLDRIISEQTNYSRKEIKKLISKGLVLVNDEQIIDSKTKFDDNISLVVDGVNVEIVEHYYLLLNKPEGYISTTDSNEGKSVLDLVPDKYKIKKLFPAGRLDKDTTGLMIITDDGEFDHNILSPKKHVKKIYEVTIDISVTEEMVKGFKDGVVLNDGECKTAILERTGEYTCNVTLSEGRYHQIKRMFGCYKAKVIKLNRICIGNFMLPDNLKLGDIKKLSEEELELIQERVS